VKQINIRQLGRLSAKALKAGPFEVIERHKPIGRFTPYAAADKPMPRHDFVKAFLKVHGKFASKGETFKLPEFGGWQP